MAGNVPLIIMMILSIVLLFAAMVLSAMASSAATKENCPNDIEGKSHRYSMYSAIVCGIASAIITVVLFIYIFRTPIGEYTSGKMQNLQQQVDMMRGVNPAAGRVLPEGMI